MARRIVKAPKLGSRGKRLERDLMGLLPITGNDAAILRQHRAESELEPKTDAQADYINAIETSSLTFGIGPAGTGKTYIAASIAARRLADREVERLIVTRPVVEAGEELGFLPGEMEEKVAPYFAPVRMILERRLGAGQVEYMIKAKKIEFMPLAYMRGHTLENAFVLLDEAQNTTPGQMKLLLTRIGEDSTVVVDGDLTQKDIAGPSGLIDAFLRLRGLRSVAAVEFTHDDVVRSGLVADILRRYEHTEEAEDRAALDSFLRATVSV